MPRIARVCAAGYPHNLLSDESRFNDNEIKYRGFLSEDVKEINVVIRRATSTGRPLGSEKFINW
jgi:hypothetical protein